jgi:hypothetical protein
MKKVIDYLTEQFVGYDQHDAHEFFRFYIERINSEMNKGRSAGYTAFKYSSTKLLLSQQVLFWKDYRLLVRRMEKILS